MILAVILAHGGAQDACQRHLPIWRKVCDRVLFATPADAPLRLPDEWQFVYGRSARYSAATNLRTREALRLASALNPSRIIFCEWDALLWDPLPENVDPLDVMGSRFENVDPKFRGSFYLHSPIILSPRGYISLLSVMDGLPDDAEYGFGDRYIGLAAQCAQVRVVDGHSHGLSFSQNHIDAGWIDKAIEARRRGCIFMHGIKEKWVFDLLAAVKKT